MGSRPGRLGRPAVANPDDRSRDLARVEANLAEIAAQWLTEADEVQAPGLGVGLGAVGGGMSVGGQHPEMANQWLKVAVIAGGRDHRA
jgi:hypothetical protein